MQENGKQKQLYDKCHNPVDELRHIRIDDILHRIVALHGGQCSRHGATQHPAVVLQYHQSCAGDACINAGTGASMMPLQMQSPRVSHQASTEGAIRGEIAKIRTRLEAYLVGDNWRSQHRWNTVGIHCRGIAARTACARRTAVHLLSLACIRLVEAPTYDNAVLANDVLRLAGA